MGVLDSIEGPRDLDRLDGELLAELAQEIRDFLIDRVARTGGHLGPNLGVVELTLALHRVFESPRDRILFDVGHQAYVHKILTGRREAFDRLKQADGLSGYPSQAESEHDVIENSHASTALSYADGLAKAYQLRGERRQVAAVVGDGALTGGMAWEALNNIAAAKDRPMVIVVNDNERSYQPTIGGLANHLATLRMTDGYEQFLQWGKSVLRSTPAVGRPLLGALHGAKKGFKDFVAPQGMFEDLGLKYVGPIDGHDEAAVEAALRRAKGFNGPVIVHCLTEKGRGYSPAEVDIERFHQVKAIHPDTGLPVATAGRDWTAVFSDEMVRLGAERPGIVAISAAMLRSTGLEPFAEKYPDRAFDVGIAEQHATTSAAGLALGGMHPVVAVYSTFLNRAFDQVLMDVALHRCGVTFALDRAGVTGDDGPSHNGMWDLSALHIVPGLRIAAPRDGARLRELLREAVDVEDAPTVLRYPKGSLPEEIPAVERVGGTDIVFRSPDGEGMPQVLMVVAGAMAATCREAAPHLPDHGVGVTLVDPRWLRPVDPALLDLARTHDLVVTVEDNGRAGGYGSALAQALEDADVATPHRALGLPQEFLAPGGRSDILAAAGLSARAITRRTVEAVARVTGTSGIPATDPRRPVEPGPSGG